MGDRHIAGFFIERAADNAHGQPVWYNPHGFFFKLGLFHHPMGEAAQQFQLRPAAFKSAIPQPCLIRRHQRDASFADPFQHQQGFVVNSGHNDGGVFGWFDFYLAEPAAPTGGAVLALIGRKFLKPFGHGVALADVGDLRCKAFFIDPRRGATRQHGS